MSGTPSTGPGSSATPVRTRLRALSFRHRLGLYGWLFAILPLIVLGFGVQHRLNPTPGFVPGSEPERAAQLAKSAFGESEQLLVLLQGPAKGLRAESKHVAAELSADPSVTVLDPFVVGGKALLPKPGKAVLLVSVAKPFEEVAHDIPELRERLRETVRPPYTSNMTGYPDLAAGVQEETVKAVERGEMLAALPLLLVLLLVLRSPIAAGITLFFGGTIALGCWGVIDVVNRFTPLDVSAFSLGTAMSLALGVDYSLLMVRRFQTEMASGATVDEALRIATTRAGQTIRVAALVLAVTMAFSLVLIPASVLKSAVAGVLIATALGLLAATVALPPLLRVVGGDIDRWRLSRKPAGGEGGNRWSAFAEKVLRRPVVCIVVVLALLAPLCLPALNFPTGPPDPSVLPADSTPRVEFEAIKDAIGGTYAAPYVITVAAKSGTLADKRFRQLANFERKLNRDKDTLAVVGPARVAVRTAALAKVPRKLRRADAHVKRGRKGLVRLKDELRRAADGGDMLLTGLKRAASGSSRLKDGGSQARDGSVVLRDGLGLAERGSAQLRDALTKATTGARALRTGLRQADEGTDKLIRGLDTARRETKQALPDVARLAAGLTEGRDALRQLQEPSDIATKQAQLALDALDKMLPTSKLDPRYAEAYKAAATSLAALTGKNPLTGEAVREGYPGLTPALGQAADQAGTASEGVVELQKGLTELVDGLGRLSNGGSQLDRGLGKLSRGAGQLADGAAELLSGANRLQDGLERLSGGAGQLTDGLGRLSSGTGQLAQALGGASKQASPLLDGLGRLQAATAKEDRQTRQLARELAGSEDLAPLFRSGYTTLAALETAPRRQREAASWAINFKRGGDVAQFFIVERQEDGDDASLPTGGESPYRDRLQELAGDLGRQLNATALVGGPAATLSEFDSAVASKLPLMMIVLLLVSYLGLAIVLRNPVLPAIAVSLNVISVAAAFGVLTLTFGDPPLLGGPGYVDDIMAAAIFTVTFALSIDYEIFLLDRMREGYDATGDARKAITYGLEHTAGVISGAGAIIVAVFLAFVFSSMPNLRQLGLGLTVAVILDATVVRLVLLPAALQLVGDRAWRTYKPDPAARRPQQPAVENA